MPTLKQLTCTVEWTGSNVPLQEFEPKYGDGNVEAFIAVPPVQTPFSIHLKSHGYIAPGLAMFVWMDGDYQCNRNRVDLAIPSLDGTSNPGQTEINFRVRQKEIKQPDGTFCGQQWKFRELNIVPDADASLASPPPHGVDHVGAIEVIILRCMPRGKKAVFKPKVQSSNVKRATNAAIKATPEVSSDSSSDDSWDDDGGSGIGGLFDGAGDSPRGNSRAMPFGGDAGWDEVPEWGKEGQSSGNQGNNSQTWGGGNNNNAANNSGNGWDSAPANTRSPQWSTRRSSTNDHFSNDWNNPSQAGGSQAGNAPPQQRSSRRGSQVSRRSVRSSTSQQNAPVQDTNVSWGGEAPAQHTPTIVINVNPNPAPARYGPPSVAGSWGDKPLPAQFAQAEGHVSSPNGSHHSGSNKSGSNKSNGSQKNNNGGTDWQANTGPTQDWGGEAQAVPGAWDNTNDKPQENSDWNNGDNGGDTSWGAGDNGQNNNNGNDWNGGNNGGDTSWGAAGNGQNNNNGNDWNGGDQSGQNNGNGGGWNASDQNGESNGNGAALNTNGQNGQSNGNGNGWGTTGQNGQSNGNGGGWDTTGQNGQSNGNDNSWNTSGQANTGDAQNGGNDNSWKNKGQDSGWQDNAGHGTNNENGNTWNTGNQNGGSNEQTQAAPYAPEVLQTYPDWASPNAQNQQTKKSPKQQSPQQNTTQQSWGNNGKSPMKDEPIGLFGRVPVPADLSVKEADMLKSKQSDHGKAPTSKAGAMPVSSRTKPYWPLWNGPLDEEPETEEESEDDEGPVYNVPAGAAMRNDVSHQVQGGRSAAYVHKQANPEYMDKHDNPYATFTFHYRSQGVIEKKFNVSLAENEEEEKERLCSLSKEELIEHYLKAKASASSKKSSSSSGGSKKKDNMISGGLGFTGDLANKLSALNPSRSPSSTDPSLAWGRPGKTGNHLNAAATSSNANVAGWLNNGGGGNAGSPPKENSGGNGQSGNSWENNGGQADTGGAWGNNGAKTDTGGAWGDNSGQVAAGGSGGNNNGQTDTGGAWGNNGGQTDTGGAWGSGGGGNDNKGQNTNGDSWQNTGGQTNGGGEWNTSGGQNDTSWGGNNGGGGNETWNAGGGNDSGAAKKNDVEW